MVRYVRPLLLAALASLAFAAAVPADASAAKTPPCWKQLVNDWFDGRIDRVYPIHCYREAIANLPEDVKAYSDAPDAIRRAMLAAIRGDRGGGGPAPGGEVDRVAGGPVAGPSGPGGPSAGVAGEAEDDGGFLSQALDYVGPKNADSIPLPLLVLAGIALLLLAAAAASFIARRVQTRRVPVGGSPDGPRTP